MKDGKLFHDKKSHFYIFLFATHLQNYDQVYKSTPRKFKVHRSAHPYFFFAASLYLPYRFNAQLNTVLFQLTQSRNPFVNFLVRVPSKVIIYGTSIFIGQVLARLYWVYKRSLNASKQATYNTYFNSRIYRD